MIEDDFNNQIIAIDNKFTKHEELNIIDDHFYKAKEMFLKIYDEYINSDGFKNCLQDRENSLKELDQAKEKWEGTETYKIDPDRYCRKHMSFRDSSLCVLPKEDADIFYNYDYYRNQFRGRNPDYSSDREKYDMKISLLKKFLEVKKFPSDWYHDDRCIG